MLSADESDEPQPGLVSLADIARRTGWTREYIRLLAAGKRGPGGFPAPHRDAHPALYAWADVVEWLVRQPDLAASVTGIADLEREREVAGVTRFANVVLEFEHLDARILDHLHVSRRDVVALIDRMRDAIGS